MVYIGKREDPGDEVESKLACITSFSGFRIVTYNNNNNNNNNNK